MLVEARTLVDQLQGMIRQKVEIALEPWITEQSAASNRYAKKDPILGDRHSIGGSDALLEEGRTDDFWHSLKYSWRDHSKGRPG
jgi:hypothetical protein